MAGPPEVEMERIPTLVPSRNWTIGPGYEVPRKNSPPTLRWPYKASSLDSDNPDLRPGHLRSQTNKLLTSPLHPHSVRRNSTDISSTEEFVRDARCSSRVCVPVKYNRRPFLGRQETLPTGCSHTVPRDMAAQVSPALLQRFLRHRGSPDRQSPGRYAQKEDCTCYRLPGLPDPRLSTDLELGHPAG